MSQPVEITKADEALRAFIAKDQGMPQLLDTLQHGLAEACARRDRALEDIERMNACIKQAKGWLEAHRKAP